mgnify:CR=1 FL=1
MQKKIKLWKNMNEEERKTEINQVLKMKEKPCVKCGVNTLYYRKVGTTKVPMCLICLRRNRNE